MISSFFSTVQSNRPSRYQYHWFHRYRWSRYVLLCYVQQELFGELRQDHQQAVREQTVCRLVEPTQQTILFIT